MSTVSVRMPRCSARMGRAYGAVVGGIAFRQDQPEHALRAERAHRQRDACGAVDAAGDRDHQPAPLQLPRGDAAQARGDAVGFRVVVEIEHPGAERQVGGRGHESSTRA